MTRDEIEKLLQKIDDITSDLKDFDGDRRGHYAAREAAENELGSNVRLARQLLAVMDERDRLVQAAYYEGYSAGYHTSNPQKDIAPDWLGSDARAALQGETAVSSTT